MRWAVPILCLAGAVGVWAWALFAPKEADLVPLTARFVGTFRFVQFEPPPGRPLDNPLPAGLRHIYAFRPDGTYAFSVFVSGGYEFLREEGVVTVGTAGLQLTRVTKNGIEDRAPPESFHPEWGQDQEGPFLALRHATLGYTFRFRPEKTE